MRRKVRGKGEIVLAFGVGFVIALCCPLQLLVVLLALGIIVLGISACRC